MEEILEFSPVRDLAVELLTDGHRYLYLVSSQSLRIGSPVWMKSLDPDSKFQPLEKISVNGVEYRKSSAGETDHQSLTILFNMFHHQHRKIPRKIEFSTLRGLAMLVDEYDCADTLGLWPKQWIESLLSEGNSAVCLGAGFEDWLFIGSIFADIPECAVAIHKISRRLIKEIVVVNAGDGEVKSFARLNGRRRTEVDMHLAPQKIIDFIVKEREQRIKTTLRGIQRFAQGMMDTSYNSSSRSRDMYCKSPDCFAFATGSLNISLFEQRLHFVLQGEIIGVPECSLQEIVAMIDGLRMTTLLLEDPSMPAPASAGARPDHQSDQELDTENLQRLLRPPTGGLFLRNQQDHSKFQGTRFRSCPLAARLAKLQMEAKEVLRDVPGYEPSGVDVSRLNIS